MPFEMRCGVQQGCALPPTHFNYIIHWILGQALQDNSRVQGSVYQADVRSILLHGCETWPVRVADERMLDVFHNDRTRRNLRVRCRDCLPSVEQRRRLCLTRSCNDGCASLVMSINGPNLWPRDYSSKD